MTESINPDLDATLEAATEAYRAANDTVTDASLALLVQRTRAEVPEAKTLTLEWSDQGDYLTPVDVDGDSDVVDGMLYDDLYDIAANLDGNTRHRWQEYGEWSEGRPDRGYFRLDLDRAASTADHLRP